MSTPLEEFRSYWADRPLGYHFDVVRYSKQAEFLDWVQSERAARPMAERRGEDGPWRIAREVIEAQLRVDLPCAYVHDGPFWLELAECGGCLDDEWFGRVVDCCRGNLGDLMLSGADREALYELRAGAISSGLELEKLEVKEALDARLRRKIALALETMDEAACGLLRAVPFTGIEWLVQACRCAAALASPPQSSQKNPLLHLRRAAVAKLASSALEPDEVACLPKLLEGFDSKALVLVVEHSKEGGPAIRRLLEKKPGFKELLVLQDHLREGMPGERRVEYVENPPESGEFEVHELQQLMDEVPAELVEWFCESLATAEEAMVLNAVKGTNRARLDAALKRHGQMALKAYSLLPLPADGPSREAEVQRRYVQIDEFLKGSKRFGSERQANNRICGEVALQNLARHAGYHDADELFFDIESKSAAGAGLSFEEDGCRAFLEFDCAGPSLAIEKWGKALKSVPAAMKKSPAFKELKATRDLLKDQGRRFRRALEIRMTSGASFERRHFDALWRAPLLRGLISSLVFLRADGQCGLPGEDGESLVTVDGRRISLGDGPLIIAHAIHLEHNGGLAAWRNLCFATGLVQAIKQVFREFYVVTSAEEATSPESFRFAGHRVASSPLGGMLKNRGWTTKGISHEPEPKKHFRSLGVIAKLCLEECGYYLAETESVVTGAVSFLALDGRLLDLDEVPATIFSEVMRDLDLFVSVAHTVGGAGSPSAELMAQRFELLRGLVGRLKLPGVSLDGHFARIEGQLATYRVHLASGAVFLGEGRHLCIVPETSWKQPPDLYLPFLEEDDRRIAEIFSKILMLSKDTAIKDPQILSQIAAAKGGIRE
ncbi:DUF4132 domain-containing protein [Luteolibacter arcticus]|uniref:DUF4132 domain-containing protein n=1 Tax=Luteolibacter arcticus TaxID=1581411 RepID=A0ABT3GN95_9BACT|nr:DUF4132 domain-containing protein [Luteolibacter arcticus]MCW1924991.1 DUF4132 domain-containing protein [Luteolibacter arcticus]